MKNLIFKSSFHEKLKVLIIPMMLLTLGVGQMWATYYYRGEKNSWGATAMTDVSGIYSYYSATSGAHQFKISTSTSSYDYNYTYVTKNYKQTDVSNIGDYNSDNCYCWQSSAHYILVFNPNTSVNSTNKPIICAATALPSAGFESDGNTISYYNNVDGDKQSSALDRENGTTIDLTSKAITDLYLKAFNTKMYQHYEVNLLDKTAYHFYYKIHRTAEAAGSTGFTEITSADGYSAGSVTWGSFDGSKYRKPTYYVTANQSLLSGLGSGLYTMSYYFTHVGTTETYRLPSTSSKYNELKWKIAAPAVSDGAVTSNGTGTGAEGSPFSVADGNTITFTASGSQASTDANSVLYVKWGSDDYAPAASTTKTLTPTTTKKSMTVKLKYYNSTDNLSGSETTLTIYYQSTLIPSIAISSFTQGASTVTSVNSEESVTINASRQNAGEANITYQYSTDNSNWETIGSATSSTTQAWTTPAVTSTTTYYIKASMSYGGNSYSDTKTITVYGKKVIKVKNTNGWSPFYMHRWGGDRPATSFPGDASQISAYGTGQWKQVVLYSSNTSFIFVDGTNTGNKNSDQTYAGVSDGGCYEIASGTGTLALNSTANCPAKPTVATNAASTIRENSATISITVSNHGNDAITSYGYYISTNSTLSSSNLSVGTQNEMGTSLNSTSAQTVSKTGLTTNTTYYVLAYATNGQGTSYGTVKNFTTLNTYTVTVTAGAGGSASPSSVTAGQYLVSGTITASANTGYVFYNWTQTSGSGTVTFTNANATSTTLKSTSTATVRANFVDMWNLKGDQWDSWDYQPMTATANANEYSKSFTLTKGTKYQFKVVKRAYNGSAVGTTDTWYGNTNNAGNKVFHRGDAAFTTVADGMNNNLEVTPDVSGTYTFTINTSGSTPVFTLTFQPAYTVTFGFGTGGSAVTASGATDGAINSGDYVKAGDDVTFTQTASSAGYNFKGWYTTPDGNTTVPTMSSSDNVLNGIAANANVYAQYTANKYTVHFNNNGGTGAIPGDITVTYGQPYGTLPSGPTPPGAEAFAGWFTAQTGGTQVTPETIVSTASEHTLWARFESTFAVTVQYKCGSDVLRAQTTTQASEVSVAGSLNAPEIIGYTFSEWTGDNATFADKNAASTTVHVTAATTVVANYVAHPTLYFKNNLSWDDVYVTFDCNWVTAGGKQVPGNYGKPYFKMTQLGNSDIFYCAIPDTYTSSDYAGWKNNIAFDNHGFSSSENIGTKTGGFDAGAFLGRGDFDPLATMFIPYDGDTESRNGGTYYRTGCWLRYNSTSSGYRVQINEWKEGEHADSYLVDLTSDVAGGTEFKATVYMDAQASGYEYGFKLYKYYQKNGNAVWYSNTGDIHPSTNTLPWHFWTDDVTATSRRCGLEKEANGDYVFTVSFGTGRPVVNVTYPVSVGDYQLVYKDRATWSNGAHDANWNHPSRIIKATANATDIISFFVSKETGADASVKLYKCTSISGNDPVWDSGTDVDISSISTTGVYNFSVTQNASKVATVSVVGEYTGNYYIRSDASDGGWSHYKTSGANNMTYTEYSLTHGGDFGPYSHYFMRHVNSGSNIKFCIANDYSQCISDTVVDDTYAHEWIEAEANIRFMWYNGTNKIGRAYISGSSIVSDRFLVLEGDESLFDADGHPLRGDYQVEGLNEDEMNFTDDQNWVYETTVQAKPNERVKLTAKFNGKIQYFYGADGERSESTTYQLIGGTGSTMYKMRVVYDFKTNRLLAAWLPNGDISDPTPINADVMIIRYHQDDAQQITFSDDGKLTDVKTVYGAMEFNKYRLNNQRETYPHEILGISNYERDLFFISFPFDVKLNDVFGFGQYGKHWIIEYYDGKTRAQKGYWIDSPTNWKFVTKAMKDVFTLKANEGYVLALDLDELTMSSSVWDYGVENVYLYFPSTTTIDKIQATSATVDIDQTGYECTINRNTPDGDRRVKDSYWHLLGVPSYANATNTTSGSWTGTVPNQNPDTWTSSAPYVYSWNGHDNKFGVISSTSTTFKPMQSYLVQYAKPTIEWASVNATPKAVAARRAQNQLRDCEFRLQLMQNDEELDHTFISIRDDEEVTAEFDFSYDLSKMLYGAFTSACNVYTLIGEEQAAANCLPLTEQTTVVPVGLKVADDGEYTFSMPDGTNGVGVTLIDGVTGERTNLALTDYTVSLENGTYDQRFVLEISPIEHTTTAIENSEKTDAPNNVCKKLIDGVLYIIKDGKVFDARGARLQ